MLKHACHLEAGLFANSGIFFFSALGYTYREAFFWLGGRLTLYRKWHIYA
jgi:hypothetical protein